MNDEMYLERIENISGQTMDLLLGWEPGTAAWLDVQKREIAAVLGDDVSYLAFSAWSYYPRPFRRHSRPSCLVWVSVDTAAVLALQPEPIDLDNVRVLTRRKRSWLPGIPDFGGPMFDTPNFEAWHWKAPNVLGAAGGQSRYLEALDRIAADFLTGDAPDMPAVPSARTERQLDRLRELGYDV